MDSMDIAANMRNLSRLEHLNRCGALRDCTHRLGKYDLLVDYESYLDHENYNAYVYDKTTKTRPRNRRSAAGGVRSASRRRSTRRSGWSAFAMRQGSGKGT